MPGRVMTLKNLLDKKHKTFSFTGDMAKVFGIPETHGAWLIYGNEKHGKTRFALQLAKYLATFKKVLYVSGEEGSSKAFVDTCIWAGLDPGKSRVGFLEYEPIEELDERLKKPKAPRIVVLDNLVVYGKEIGNGRILHLLKDHPDVLFIFMAHEERREPYPGPAKLARKLAKVIVRVEGLACVVSGRVPGGTLTIDEEKAELFHGNAIKATR
jgi:hypothetical protein